MVGRSAPSVLAIMTIVACVGSFAQEPRLEASLDRASIRENESFLYTLRAEGAVRGEPELAAIEQDFDVLGTRSNSRVQIVNGRMEQVAEWQIQMMPKRSGQFTLPPARLGNLDSNELSLEVLPALPPGDQLADIFMEVEARPETAYVQSQVIFTLRLFVGIGTGRATLTAPQVSGGEAIVERLGEDSQYRTLRDGRDFIVRERRYAVFPQETGVLTIGPATFEAMVIPSRGFSRVQRFRSEAVEVSVLPAVSAPAEYPNAVWLPASGLSLSERWSDEPEQFELGIPRTRTLTVDAVGLLQTQLPELNIEQADGIRQYADQPELDSEASADGLSVSRTERFAVIAQRGGEVELPGVELPWWNVDEERWEVARIAPRTVVVLPSTESTVDPGPAPVSPVAESPPPDTSADLWRITSGFLGVGWLVTGLLWWRSGRSLKPRKQRASAKARTRWSLNRRLIRELRAACRDNDATRAQQLVMDWAQLRFPDDVPATLGALAQRLPEPAALAICELETCLYGRDTQPWDGAALNAAMESLESVSVAGRHKRADALLPLYR